MKGYKTVTIERRGKKPCSCLGGYTTNYAIGNIDDCDCGQREKVDQICSLIKEKLDEHINNGFMTPEYFKECIYNISKELGE